MDVSNLPYRPCVGLMVLSPQRLIFAGQRIDNTAEAWQMPQGGVDEGETPIEAALRELGEETGLAPDHVNVLGESQDWLTYDLPADLVPRLWGGRYRGQKQKWFALELTAGDAAINIATAEPEFSQWRWLDAPTLMDKIVPFKRALYTQVFEEFSALLKR
ncbi:MAG: RNA pyrophosphohydrolase [Neomegalonema sp.]|nr:RNA pyrophosphohydrolase [Neomegalonema sp.]